MSHVEVSVDFLKGSVFVSEVAPFAVRAEALTVELSAVLRLVFVVRVSLFLLIHVQVVRLAQLVHAVSVLAFVAVATEASLIPVFAQLSLVHGPFNESFALLGRRRATHTLRSGLDWGHSDSLRGL